jgi:tRNA A37 N6-isopentenylltransferase MiaA
MRAGGIEAGALPQLLAARTRKLARAQLTWLRKTPSLVELDVGTRSPEQSLPDLLAAWHG